MRKSAATLLAIGWCAVQLLRAQPFMTNDVNPAIERWMYANNTDPCERVAGSTFAILGDDSGVDTRLGQHLIGWDTAALIPTNHSPSHYLIRQCQLTLTINRGNLFVYDPTEDDYRTFFPTNDPAYQPDIDAGSPMELFGVGYRNGYETNGFSPCDPFGSNAPGLRNAYASCWSTNGTLVDVSNNVGKTNVLFLPFQESPFAIGQTTNVPPGQFVPAGAKITFDLNLADPFVVTYLQRSLNSGQIRFMLSSLHLSGGQFSQPNYPDYVTHFNDAVVNPTSMTLDASVVRDLDTDHDGLPDDWEMFYFGNLDQGANDDPDGDGVSNLDEYLAGTDPTQAKSAFHLAMANATTLHWPNLPSRRFVVKFSNDLKNWQTVTNAAIIYPSPTTATWTDLNPSSSNRFYRVQATAQ
jgi:Bacterial TSP3 repeat